MAILNRIAPKQIKICTGKMPNLSWPRLLVGRKGTIRNTLRLGNLLGGTPRGTLKEAIIGVVEATPQLRQRLEADILIGGISSLKHLKVTSLTIEVKKTREFMGECQSQPQEWVSSSWYNKYHHYEVTVVTDFKVEGMEETFKFPNPVTISRKFLREELETTRLGGAFDGWGDGM